MSIVLLILKIIGLVLLGLLGLLLLLLGIVLFLPIRYRFDMNKEMDFNIRFRISWLLRLFGIYFSYDGSSAKAYFRILFFRKQLYPKPELKPKRKKRKQKKTKENSRSSKNHEGASLVIADTSANVTSEIKQESVTASYETPSVVKEKQQKRWYNKAWEKIKNIPKSIVGIRHKIQNIFAKMKDIYHNSAHYIRMIRDEENQKTFRLIRSEAVRLLKKFGPTKGHAFLEYGFEDPSLTGRSLAVLCLFPIVYHKNMKIMPDFSGEQTFLKGNCVFTGRIQLIHLVITLVRLWKDKNIKKMIHSRL